MRAKPAGLLERVRLLEDELETEFEAKRRRFKYRIAEDRVRFEHEVSVLHRRFRKSIPSFLRDANWLTILTSPLIYSLVLPLVLLDLWASAYQRLCFPIYGIERVRRSDYLIIDHQFLAYLNPIEKLGCVYCSYGNGLIAYVREIAARTERHFCPIKHARRAPDPHSKYHEFFDYGDAAGYRAWVQKAPIDPSPR